MIIKKGLPLRFDNPFYRLDHHGRESSVQNPRMILLYYFTLISIDLLNPDANKPPKGASKLAKRLRKNA